MVSQGTVDLLHSVWESEVREHLEGELARIHRALEMCDSEPTFRALQGKARAFRSLMDFPEHLKMRLEGKAPVGYALPVEAPKVPEDEFLRMIAAEPLSGIPTDEDDDL